MHTERPLIYLATPYTHRDTLVMLSRRIMASQIAAKMIRNGRLVYSPIAATTRLADDGGLNDTWDQWAEYDRDFLRRCDMLAVAKMSGWRESNGVSHEIAIAYERGIPIKLVNLCGEFLGPLSSMEIERCVSYVQDQQNVEGKNAPVGNAV